MWLPIAEVVGFCAFFRFLKMSRDLYDFIICSVSLQLLVLTRDILASYEVMSLFALQIASESL